MDDARCAAPLAPVLSMQVQKVTPEELEVAIANREKAILVDFFGRVADCAQGKAVACVNELAAAAQQWCWTTHVLCAGSHAVY